MYNIDTPCTGNYTYIRTCFTMGQKICISEIPRVSHYGVYNKAPFYCDIWKNNMLANKIHVF